MTLNDCYIKVTIEPTALHRHYNCFIKFKTIETNLNIKFRQNLPIKLNATNFTYNK